MTIVKTACYQPRSILDIDDEETRKTKALLEDAFKKNPKILDHIYNGDIHITPAWKDFSHSVPLTINTRFNNDPEWLVSAFLHEQMHNFLMGIPDKVYWNLLLGELEEMFPGAPSGIENPYGHIVVCLLEYKAMQNIFGRKVALDVLERQDKYEWVYQIVRDNEDSLTSLIGMFGYLPHGL